MDLLNTFLNTLFVELLNRSISVSWLIVAVIVLRLALKRAPKWVACLLWAMVAVRLVCPVNIPSPVSVYNLMESETSQTGSVAYFYYNDSLEKPEVSIDFPAIPGYPDNQETPSADGAGIHTSRAYLPPMRAFWLTGVACMAAYGLTSYLKLRRRVRVSLKVGEHSWICDEISSPFILGVIRPRIYLPSDLSGEELEYVMAHEQAHLRRRDHWWKLLGYLLLTVYWFHPLVWAAYALFCRDIELACDEKVCKGMDAASRKAYAATLLHCSISERSVAICPLSFSEVGVKERVKAVLHYKKPAFWVVTAAVVVCGVVAVCFLTNPADAAVVSEALDSAASSVEDADYEAQLKEYAAFGVTQQSGKYYYQDEPIRYFLDGYERDDGQGGQNVISRYVYYNGEGTVDVHTVREDQKNADGSTELFGPIIDIVPYSQEEFDQREFSTVDGIVTDDGEATFAEERETQWVDSLEPYLSFGLTYRYDASTDDYRMYYGGKEVRGIYDEVKELWISEHTGNSSYAEDAIDLYAVYENHTLSGLREATDGERAEWTKQREMSAYETQAQELIQKAFAYDVSGIEPENDVLNDGEQTTFMYTTEQDDKFYVQLSEEEAYPMMVYHFCHSIEDETFDLAQESSDYFKEDMIQAAKDFVKDVYEVDCSNAEVHAYGYKNKICVQLEVSPEKAFHVRFYYDDLTPVGILFYHDVTELERLMETNHAKQYF